MVMYISRELCHHAFLSGTQHCPAALSEESLAKNRRDSQNLSEQPQWVPEYLCPGSQEVPQAPPSEPVHTTVDVALTTQLRWFQA